jgi:hypothetical protein
MTPEKNLKDNKQKQKIIIGVLVLVVLVIAWQVLKPSGDTGVGSPTPAVSATGAKPMMGSPNAPSSSSNNAMGANSPPPAPTFEAPKQAPVLANAEALKLQQETQGKYLAALNELQMLKLQKEIAETKEGITAATLSTATTEKSITDLLTVQQAPSAGQFGPSQPQLQPAAPIPQPTSAPQIAPAPAPLPAPKPNSPALPYSLLSVSFEGSKWNAVIGFQEKLYTVGVGDSLPPDDSIVEGINKDGVMLKKDKETRKIMMTPSL